MALRFFGSFVPRKLSRSIFQRSPRIIEKRALRPAAGTGSLQLLSASSGAARPLHDLRCLTQGDSSGGGSDNPVMLALSVLAALSITGIAYLKSSGEALASRRPEEDELPESIDWTTLAEDYLPESIDWEALGAVNSPRDQGRCGSCWAHVGVGAMESIHHITWNELPRLSVQAVIDCAPRTVGDKKIRGGGCKGGLIEDSFEYVMQCGIPTEKKYPRRWFNRQGPCEDVGRGVATIIHGYSFVHGTEEALMRAVAKQPVAILVDHFPNETLYEGGLIEIEEWPPAKDPKQSQVHALLLVAYGTDTKGNKFWKARNTRGTKWGDRGYCYLRRGGANKQGVGGMYRYNGVYPVIKRVLP